MESSPGGKLRRLASRLDYNTLKESNSEKQPSSYDRQALQFLQIVQQSAARNLELTKELDLAKERLRQVHRYPENSMTCGSHFILSDIARDRNSLHQEPPIPQARTQKENLASKSEFNCNTNCSVTHKKDKDLPDLGGYNDRFVEVLRNNRVAADRKYYYGSAVTKNIFEHNIALEGDIQTNNNNDEYDYCYCDEDSEAAEENPYSVENDHPIKESKKYSEFENIDKMDSKDNDDSWDILDHDDSKKQQSLDEGNGYVDEDEDEDYNAISDKNQIILPDELSLDLHDVLNVYEFQHNCSNSHKIVPQNMRMSSDANSKSLKRFTEVKGPVSSIKSYILSDPSSPSYLKHIRKSSKTQKAPSRCKPTLNEATTQTAAHKAISAKPRIENNVENVAAKECKDIIIPKARVPPKERNNFSHRLSGKPRTSFMDEFSMEEYELAYMERNAAEYHGRIPSEVFKKWKNLSAMFNEATYEHRNDKSGQDGTSCECNDEGIMCNWAINKYGNNFDVIIPSFEKTIATHDKTVNTLERPLTNYDRSTTNRDSAKVSNNVNEIADRIIRCNGVPIKYFDGGRDGYVGTTPATPSLEQKCSSDYIDQALEEAINDKNMKDLQNVYGKGVGRHVISIGTDAQTTINKENVKHRNITNSNSHDYQVKSLIEDSDPEVSPSCSLKVVDHDYYECKPNNSQSSSNLGKTQNPSSSSKTDLMQHDQLPKNFRKFCHANSSQDVSKGKKYFKALIVDESQDGKIVISHDLQQIRGRCQSERSLSSEQPQCKNCQHHQKEFGNTKSRSVCPSMCDCSKAHNWAKLRLHKCDFCESLYCSPCSEGSVSSSGDMITNQCCHSEDNDSFDGNRQSNTNALISTKFEPSYCQESCNTRCEKLVNCENQIKFCFQNIGQGVEVANYLASDDGFQDNNVNSNNNNDGSIHLASQRVNASNENMFCRHCNTIFRCFVHHWNDIKPNHSKCDLICIQQFSELMKILQEHISSSHQDINEYIHTQVNNNPSPGCPPQNSPRKSCDQSRETDDNVKGMPEPLVQKSNTLDFKSTSQEHKLESSIYNLNSSSLDDVTNMSQKHSPQRLSDKFTESLLSDFDRKSGDPLNGKDCCCNDNTFSEGNPKIFHTCEPKKLQVINKDYYIESVSNQKLRCNPNHDLQAGEISKGDQQKKMLQIQENKISEFDLGEHFANDDVKNNYFEEVVSNSRIDCQKLEKWYVGQCDISSPCSEQRCFQLTMKNVSEMLKSKSEAKFEINYKAKKVIDQNNNNSSRKFRKVSPTISQIVKECPDSRRLVKEILYKPRNVRRHRSQHPFIAPKYSADHSLMSMQSVKRMLRERDETRNLLLSELERLRDTLKKERLNFIGELSATRQQMIDYELEQKKKMECLEKTVCERLEMYDKLVKSHPAPHNIDFGNLLFPPKNGSNVNPESFVDPSLRSNANSIHQNPDFQATNVCQNQVKASSMPTNFQPNASDNVVMHSPDTRYTNLKSSPNDFQAQNAINIAMKAREPLSASMRFYPPTLLLNSNSRKNEKVDFSTYRQAINNCAGQTANLKENILGNWTKETHNNLPPANKLVPNMTYPRAYVEQVSHFVNPNGAIVPNFSGLEKTQNCSNTFQFSSFQNNPAEHPLYHRCNGTSNTQARRIQENESEKIANQLVGPHHTGHTCSNNLTDTIFSSRKKQVSESPENVLTTTGVENVKRGYISADKQEPYVTLLSNKMSSSLRSPEVVIQAHQMNKDFQRHMDMSMPMRSLMCQMQNSSRNNSNSKCLQTLHKGEETANVHCLIKGNHVSRKGNEIENVTEVDAKCKQNSFSEKHDIINSCSKNRASQNRVLCSPCFSTLIETGEPNQELKAFFEKYPCGNKLQKLDFQKENYPAASTDHRFHVGISGNMMGTKPKTVKESHFQSEKSRSENLFHPLWCPRNHDKVCFSSRSSASKSKARNLFTHDAKVHKEMRNKHKFGSSRRFRFSGTPGTNPQGDKRTRASKKSTSVGSLRSAARQGCNSIGTYFSRWSAM